jgi:hypothetical protein
MNLKRQLFAAGALAVSDDSAGAVGGAAAAEPGRLPRRRALGRRRDQLGRAVHGGAAGGADYARRGGDGGLLRHHVGRGWALDDVV